MASSSVPNAIPIFGTGIEDVGDEHSELETSGWVVFAAVLLNGNGDKYSEDVGGNEDKSTEKGFAGEEAVLLEGVECKGKSEAWKPGNPKDVYWRPEKFQSISVGLGIMGPISSKGPSVQRAHSGIETSTTVGERKVK